MTITSLLLVIGVSTSEMEVKGAKSGYLTYWNMEGKLRTGSKRAREQKCMIMMLMVIKGKVWATAVEGAEGFLLQDNLTFPTWHEKKSFTRSMLPILSVLGFLFHS